MKKLTFGLLSAVLLLSACATGTPVDTDKDDDGGASSSIISSSGPFLDQGDEASSEPAAIFDLSSEGAAVRVVRVSAANWVFTPASITVKKGEKVRLEVALAEGRHGISIPGLGIEVRPAEGQTAFSVDLPTDKAGTFEGFCNIPCGDGHKDMKLTVIVEE